MDGVERRVYQFDITEKESENGKVLHGRPIVFNSTTDIGPFDETIAPGALDGTDLTDVPFLVNHDEKMIPLARSRRNNGSSTMFLKPVSEGMDIDVTLDTEDNPVASALYSAVKREDVDGMSFAFIVTEDKWDDMDTDHPTRTITKIGKVIEVSAVTFPAYQKTYINARTAGQNDMEVLERARRTYLDEKNSKATKKSELEAQRLKAEIKSKS